MSNIIPLCDSPEDLKDALVKLNLLDPLIHLDCLQSPNLNDAVGILRMYKKKGESVDLESRAPLAYFRRQAIRLCIKNNPDRSTGSLSLQERLALDEGLISGFLLVDEWIHLLGRQSFEGRYSEEVNAKRGYDHLRLRIASRILELETGENTTHHSELVPRFCETELVDPTTEKPYILSEALTEQ